MVMKARWLWVQTQSYHLGVGAPPILVYFSENFSGDGDVHWGYGSLTHGQIGLIVTFTRPERKNGQQESVPCAAPG